jgi:hypothetical protein
LGNVPNVNFYVSQKLTLLRQNGSLYVNRSLKQDCAAVIELKARRQ